MQLVLLICVILLQLSSESAYFRSLFCGFHPTPDSVQVFFLGGQRREGLLICTNSIAESSELSPGKNKIAVSYALSLAELAFGGRVIFIKWSFDEYTICRFQSAP